LQPALIREGIRSLRAKLEGRECFEPDEDYWNRFCSPATATESRALRDEFASGRWFVAAILWALGEAEAELAEGNPALAAGFLLAAQRGWSELLERNLDGERMRRLRGLQGQPGREADALFELLAQGVRERRAARGLSWAKAINAELEARAEELEADKRLRLRLATLSGKALENGIRRVLSKESAGKPGKGGTETPPPSYPYY
jgi:hypothetical protein